MAKALEIILLGMIIIGVVVVVKYKPVYEVQLEDQSLGYIENRDKLELELQNYMKDMTGNVAFKEQLETPEYELKFVNRNKQTQDKEIKLALESAVKITYKTYAVMVNGEKKTSVLTEDDAKNIIANIKSDIDADQIGLNIGIVEEYSENLSLQSTEEAEDILKTIKVAKIIEYNQAQEQKRKEEALAAKKKVIATKTVENVGMIAGINLTRPINGQITSRYGSRSSIRSGSHTGLDIAASLGTPVRPIASGTVTHAGWKGSYGNLVIINHGNGIESYYAHCHEIYVAVGQKVDVATLISAVGSTGNSTGPHLHLEIRQNGTPLNPEDYLY